MAMRIAVTTCPCPRSLRTPNTDMGATGWITITPYRIRSHKVSVRRRRGAASVIAVAPLLKEGPFGCAGLHCAASRRILPAIGSSDTGVFVPPDCTWFAQQLEGFESFQYRHSAEKCPAPQVQSLGLKRIQLRVVETPPRMDR